MLTLIIAFILGVSVGYLDCYRMCWKAVRTHGPSALQGRRWLVSLWHALRTWPALG